jgi:hypothetical protein
MNINELLVRQLKGSLDILKNTLADFSDADMVQRPCDKANHPLWQVGHLIGSEVWMMNQVKGAKMPELPAGFAEKFDKKTAGENDLKKFGTKAELLGLFDRVRAATIDYAKKVKPETLDEPGPESMRSFCPKVGDLVALHSAHVYMHLGQMQASRRKLGKPVLF